MLSTWAMKRVCKFFLKKKLGQFILGDIDLDQLDVQLTDGSIQLNDLALNVDYLNQRFGAATSVIIKEGSIGSLLVKMPSKSKGCQVELDELEIVLAPCQYNNLHSRDTSCSASPDIQHSMQSDSSRFEHADVDSPCKFTSNDVHEGVKIIAKIVKWFLTSFHLKIKKLIIAFDPYIKKEENKVESHAALVLRISEIECGTCVSEDSTSNRYAKAESFLGISRLTNYVKFQGAILELLHMDVVDQQTGAPHDSGAPFGEVPSGCSQSNATTPIMTWKRDGFSGNIKLSIPWKDGSLDIRKVDADICIDPIELRFQPITIKWFLLSWETYKKFDEDQGAHMHYKPTDSVYFNASSHYHSSPNVSAVNATDDSKPIRSSCSTNFFSFNGKESFSETMLPAFHLIQDWVPFPVSANQKEGIEDVDLGASVDQFFECFDGMRHSQSALGSSGMWNWTCSVFSAITAASSLASGSLLVASEQQHVQTNLTANFAGISIVFSFYDEDQKHFYDLNGDRTSVGSCVHYLGAECRGIFLVVQVCPEKMSFEGTLNYIDIADCFCFESMNSLSKECDRSVDSQTISIQHLQAEVQGVLPPFAQSAKVHDSAEFNGSITAVSSFGNRGDVVKILLLRTSGIANCQFTVDANQSHGSLTRSMSFSLKLPPFIFWVNFHLINMLWDFFDEVGNSTKMNHESIGFSSEMVDEKHGCSSGDVKRGSCPPITNLSSTETLRGNIFVPDARVILCFPFDSGKVTRHYCSWDQFIVLEFSSPSSFKEEVLQGRSAVSEGSVHERLSSTAIRSLHFNVGDLDIYLVTSAYENDVGINSGSTQMSKYSAQNILSVSNSTGLLSVISMLWQEGSVTGPWITERAKLLATFEESRSRNKFMGKGSEFATVNYVNYLEDINSRIRQEIILSSAFFVHVHVFPVTVDLDSSQYSGLQGLLNQISSGLSCVAHDGVGGSEESSVSQTSIFVECNSLELVIRPDSKENLKSSIQSELPGLWNCLKLKIQNFNLLSVSNIGGIMGAGFFWLAHGEGMLWGCVSGVPSRDFLLISCSNSTMKRGDGGGSNALSSRLAGSDIVHLFEPETSHGSTSVTVRCSTIVAVGGRLDWFDAITSFFSLPSPEVEVANDNSLHKGDVTVPCAASFVLDLVDIGLSYEPYLVNLMVESEVFDSLLVSSEISGSRVACILAASSLVLSNVTVANSRENNYEIRVQDLGLLLCVVSEPEKLAGTYSVQRLRDIGYIKVAHEALLEAVLRTNCKNSLLWELECSKSHINVDTCHDTTSGLICLAAQLQQLFAPDMEESLVHLQDRYDSVQWAQERNDFIDVSAILNSDCSSPSQMHSSTSDTENKSGMVGLMDEISEDAFHLGGSQTSQFDPSEMQFCISRDDGEAECSLSVESPEIFSTDLSVKQSALTVGLQSSQTSSLQNNCLPEFIEGYHLGDFSRLPELSVGRQSFPQMHKGRSWNVRDGDVDKENSGWYRDACVQIVENHLSETSEQTSMKKVLECKLPSMDSARPDDFGKAMGRLLLKNINVTWRMYGGSDGHECRNNSEHTSKINGRDMTAYLELVLSGMQCQYDIFPVGGMLMSKLSLSVQDFHLYDRSRDAPLKLVLGYYDSKDRPRQSSSKAVKVELEVVRPNPRTPLEEYRLRVAVLPVRLHLHQSQLDFLINFFGTKSSSVDQTPGFHEDSFDSKLLATKRKNLTAHAVVEEALLPFFQKVDIWPIIIRVDYSPSRVDLVALRGGKYVELVNLVPWKGVELKLKHVHAVGIYGWGGVCETMIGEWLEDISQNQIHKVLRGLPPIRSLVSVGSGATKLVSMPVENYRKDRRVLKGMQRGTIAFLRSISLEAVGLGVHLAAGAHDILVQAEYILTSIPPSVSWPVQDNTKTNVRCNQPKDAQQGIHLACESLRNGFGRSASALVRKPLKNYQRGASAGSALATAVRGVPAAAIAPASACASAVQYALLGFRNSLNPEHKKESMEKYLGPAQSQEENWCNQ